MARKGDDIYGPGCFLNIFMTVLIMVPFLIYGFFSDVWMTDNGGWSIFIPVWLSVGVADIWKLIVADDTPAKEDPMVFLLVFLNVASFIGSTIMLAVFNYHVMYLGVAGSIVVGLLSAAIFHIFHFAMLKSAYNLKIGGIKGTKFSPHDLYYSFDDIDSDDDIDIDDDLDLDDSDIYDEPEDWLDDYDMTKDYYGKHGEFDKNDDAWGTSEYIRQFHNDDPDMDLSDHFDWQERMDAESDGYLDED